MKIEIKTFEALTTAELYQILRLRSAVFVVEQHCVYQDLDNSDQNAIHVMGVKHGEIVAYIRIFKPGTYFKAAGIGRVVVSPPERKHGYGRLLMEVALQEIAKRFGKTPIELSAQTYITAFYNGLGFVTVGKEYLEDGIPHIRMLRV